MRTYHFRVARADDIAAIVDLEAAAFKLEEHPEKRRAVVQMVQQHPETFVLLEDTDKTIVGAAHIVPQPIQVGCATVVKADLGHVAISPERQGQGLGTQLLRETVTYMTAQLYPFSRLGGFMPFYRRFGYEPFTRRFVQFEVHPPDALIKGRRWGQLLAIPTCDEDRVRHYDPSRDGTGIYTLRHRFHGNRTAIFALSHTGTFRPPPQSVAEGFVFVYESGGSIKGYMAAGFRKVEARDKNASFCIDDFAYDRECPGAAPALVKTLLHIAMQGESHRLVGRLPYDHELFDALTAGGLQFNTVEYHRGTDGNMIQILCLRKLLQDLLPELDRRLREAGCCPWEGTFALRTTDQSAAIHVNRDGVTLVPDTSESAVIACSQAMFLRWALGICGLSAYPSIQMRLTGPQRVTADILFPHLPCASGAWG